MKTNTRSCTRTMLQKYTGPSPPHICVLQAAISRGKASWTQSGTLLDRSVLIRVFIKEGHPYCSEAL